MKTVEEFLYDHFLRTNRFAWVSGEDVRCLYNAWSDDVPVSAVALYRELAAAGVRKSSPTATRSTQTGVRGTHLGFWGLTPRSGVAVLWRPVRELRESNPQEITMKARREA